MAWLEPAVAHRIGMKDLPGAIGPRTVAALFRSPWGLGAAGATENQATPSETRHKGHLACTSSS